MEPSVEGASEEVIIVARNRQLFAPKLAVLNQSIGQPLETLGIPKIANQAVQGCVGVF